MIDLKMLVLAFVVCNVEKKCVIFNFINLIKTDQKSMRRRGYNFKLVDIVYFRLD